MPDIGRITNGWYDAGVDSKIILLGSSSLDLLNKSAESLAGRNEKIYLPPLTFQEIIEDQNWYFSDFNKEEFNSHFSNQINVILIQSIVFGNYPETVTTDGKREYLINLISDYIFKDVLQFGLIKTTEPIKKLLFFLRIRSVRKYRLMNSPPVSAWPGRRLSVISTCWNRRLSLFLCLLSAQIPAKKSQKAKRYIFGIPAFAMLC